MWGVCVHVFVSRGIQPDEFKGSLFSSNTESISEKERDAYLSILGKTGLHLTDRKRSFGMVFLEAKLVCPVRVCG